MATELQTLAWDVLVDSWTVRWALILGIGSTPALLRRLGAAPSNPRRFNDLRQLCALASLVLCLDAARLMLDTFAIESEDPKAVTAATCAVHKAPFWSTATWRCSEGLSLRTARSSPALEAGQHYRVHYLPHSSTLVAAQQCNNADCSQFD